LRSDAVLELGRKIVDSLATHERVDMLAAWMAHYIAEAILAVEHSIPQERDLKSKQCADTILALWDNRNQLPTGLRPFEDLEPVFAALRSLDPHNSAPRYFRAVRGAVTKGDSEPALAEWLTAADCLDETARILISYCLGRAAALASEKTEDWVAVADAAAEKSTPELPAIRIVLNEAGLANTSELDESQEGDLDYRITRLESFMQMAESLIVEMREQAGRLHSSPPPDDGVSGSPRHDANPMRSQGPSGCNRDMQPTGDVSRE
jgi:hypothetical protein